jgi:hypothetical protein
MPPKGLKPSDPLHPNGPFPSHQVAKVTYAQVQRLFAVRNALYDGWEEKCLVSQEDKERREIHFYTSWPCCLTSAQIEELIRLHEAFLADLRRRFGVAPPKPRKEHAQGEWRCALIGRTGQYPSSGLNWFLDRSSGEEPCDWATERIITKLVALHPHEATPKLRELAEKISCLSTEHC